MENVKALALVLLLIAIIIFAPIFTIMALNTLFGLGIALTFWTWLSVVWLQMVTFGGVAASFKK
jgi:hypothetical protein